jgi:hypothetical protein
MKMKKLIIGLVAVVLVVAGVMFFTGNNDVSGEEESGGLFAFDVENGPGNRFNEEEEDVRVIELSNEIVYSGKVVPEEEVYIYIDALEEVDTLLVNTNDLVSKDDVLFTYEDNSTELAESQKVIKNEEIDDLEELIYSANEYIDEIKSWIESNTDEDKEYIYNEMIEDEIAKIESYKIQVNTLENEIDDLEDKTVNEVSKIDAIVYEIDEDQLDEVNPQKPFITLISTSRVINIDVAEYELSYISVGDVVEVEITGSNDVFEGVVKSIDLLPNNINSTDTSYYDTVIELDSSMPYGASAMISVSLGE